MRVRLIADDTTIVAAVETALLGESLVLDRAEAGEDALHQAKLAASSQAIRLRRPADRPRSA